jgi:hypothetical protein
MILKEPDIKNAAIASLQKLLLNAEKEQQGAIVNELRVVGAGITKESEPAQLINAHFGKSQNIVVIHDLRLELDDGYVANIDHLLIHRSHRFYILESKHFSHHVKVNDRGEFLRWNGWSKTFVRTSSPIEENERCSAILRQRLKLLGVPDPHIQSFVLIAPDAQIERPEWFDTEVVVSANQFLTSLNENLEIASFLGLLTDQSKATRVESIFRIAQKLIALHRPLTVDYAEQIGVGERFTSLKEARQSCSIEPAAMQANPFP